MSWPLSQDYNEAIQDPRSNFRDAELKAGDAVPNALGIPMPRSGNFADVYEVRCPSGTRWAVKCFTREVHGLRERYAEISNYLRQVNLPFMVDFQYLQEGIRVRSQWYPILKMQWVEGFVLNEFVRDNLDKKPILLALGQIWLRMTRRLRQAKLAHGDLQHSNVLFVPGSSAHSLAVKLIDYDGMCVPSLAGRNSGEVGHPAYQHPERLRTGAYNEEIDRFSLLSIAAALRCLTVGGRSLWERYDTGDNVLFRQTDLQAPAESPLFGELLTIDDPQAQLLVTVLYRACQGPLSAVPLLTDLLPEERPPSRVMTAAERQAATDEGTEWDFGDGEPATPYIRKRRASSGLPLWLWGLLGGAAAILLSVGVGAGLFPFTTTTGKAKTPLVHALPSEKSPHTKPEPRPSSHPVASRKAATWEKVDPDDDCKFQNTGGKLIITVPGVYHDLGAERGCMNAPRLLLEVEGDFTAQVRVSCDFQPSMDVTVSGKVPIVGAGLVLMADKETYVRLERFGMYREQQLKELASWEVRQNGRFTFSRASQPLVEKETYLRMERRGDRMLAAVSEDSQSWNDLPSIRIPLPRKVKLGVDAISTSSLPFAPSFDQFQLKKRKDVIVDNDWPQLR
jgi:regulation of enolase protein 1 (concanavalin A-like superfamily)